MSAPRRSAVVAASLALVAVIGGAGYKIHLQRRDLAELDELHTKLMREKVALRTSAEALRHELAQAQQQSVELSAASALPAHPSTRDTEIAAWLARVKRLRSLFAERPNQQIPELKMLIDADWLRIAKPARLDTEEQIRGALAAVRQLAVRNFANRLPVVLGEYAKAHETTPPPSVAALVSFFDPPIDPTILERYEIVERRRPSGRGPGWAVQNKSAVDRDLEERFVIDPGGWEASSGPLGWIPDFRDRYQRAAQAYTADKKIPAPRSLPDLVPYFDPPLAPADLEWVLKAQSAQPFFLPPIR